MLCQYTNNNADISNSEKSENNDTTFYTTKRFGRSDKNPVKIWYMKINVILTFELASNKNSAINEQLNPWT